VCGMRFPGIGMGEDMRAAFAGPMVVGIDNIINITIAPKIEPSFFISVLVYNSMVISLCVETTRKCKHIGFV
ncbi:hypothetical protein, partial [Candidatus Nitrosotalea sp. FS]|uniref:hypothetical protein n=1 Tax=Candidatus Nitrosotalea sp. FS TaxID=2341021 RepID=UPI001C498693